MFTRKTFHIFRWEYTQKIKSKGFIFSIIFMPTFIIGFTLVPTYFASRESQKTTNIAVADATSFALESLKLKIAESKQSHLFNFLEIPGDDALRADRDGKELVNKGIVDGYLFLDDSIFARKTVKYYVKGTGSFESLRQLENALSDVILVEQLRRMNVNVFDVRNVARKIDVEVSQINDESKIMQKYIAAIIFVMMLFFSIFNSGSAFMRGVAEEKNNRVIEVLISSVTPKELMVGKILGLGMVGLTQIVIWMLAGMAFGGPMALSILSPQVIFLFIVYFVLGYFMLAAIFSIIGAVVSSDQDIQQIQGVISAIGVVPVAFAILVLQDPDSMLVNILSYFPPLTPTLMILRVVISEPPIYHIAGTIVTLIVFLILTMRFSSRVFEVALLMYGKRPTVKEIWRWYRSKQ
ncbi:ABC transporter permease [bacterium]|nr:ABC transporter permease [bacterium]